MAYASNFDVKYKKRELIKEQVDSDPIAAKGMRISKISLMLLLLLRLILFVFEIIYFNASGLEIDVISNLLLIPMLLILYMIYDGNKGLAGVLAISAIVRAVYLFASVYPTLPEDTGAGIFVGLYLFVMAFQFVSIILMTAYSPCLQYFNKMQSINMEIGAVLRSGGASSGSVTRSSGNGSSKKKKK